MDANPRASGPGLGRMARAGEDAARDTLTLEDMFLNISAGEWDVMTEAQRRLYCDMMGSVFADALSLGIPVSRASLPSPGRGELRADICFPTAPGGTRGPRAVPGPSSPWSSEGPPSALRLSVGAPPPPARPCAPEAHLRAMYESVLQEVLPLAVRQGMPLGRRWHHTCASCATHLSYQVPQSVAETLARERGQPPRVASPLLRGPDQAFSARGLVPHQDTQGREAWDTEEISMCNQCGTVFLSKDSLVRHQRVHYERKCGQCGKILPSQNALDQHKKFHSGERPYECSTCGRSFFRKSALTAHRKCHCGKEICRCDECGREFSGQSYLAVHKRVHSGRRLYVCGECGKTFISMDNLAHHKKDHTTPTPRNRENTFHGNFSLSHHRGYK